MPHFDGKRDRLRRQMVERGEYNDLRPLVFAGYAKSGLAYAAQVSEEFTVETIEGVMQGQPGDYLAIGINGEMYPIARDVFEASYRRAAGTVPNEVVTTREAKREGQVTTTAGFADMDALVPGLREDGTVDGQHSSPPVRTPPIIGTPVEIVE